MLYKYDEALAKDLSNCIDPSGGANSIVKVIEAEGVIDLIAQMKEGSLEFPILCLTRDLETPIDTARTNFTMMHKGVPAGYDSKHNAVYMEKCIPVKLGYTLTVLATNTADIDEMCKELLFRYTNVYFIDAEISYEVDNRKFRFGVSIDEEGIKKESGSLNYIQGGKLYQAVMRLNCVGAFIVSYTPRHVAQVVPQTQVEIY